VPDIVMVERPSGLENKLRLRDRDQTSDIQI